MSTVKAFWVTSAGKGQIQEEKIASPKANENRIRTLYSGISRGTESLVWNGHIPKSLHQIMKAPFQEGVFNFPIKYGYINVGQVIEGPNVGQTVFTLYPHQTEFNLDQSFCVPIPASVSASRAILAANMETAINAIWDAQPNVGDVITVIGAGAVGLLCAYLLRQIPGSQLFLLDTNPDKQRVCDTLGINFEHPDNMDKKSDLVIHASGNPQGLSKALEIADMETKIVELSWYGNKNATLSLGETFHPNRLKIISSQVGQIPSHQKARWTFKRRLSLALRLLTDDKLDELITGEDSFETLPNILNYIMEPTNNIICHRIKYTNS